MIISTDRPTNFNDEAAAVRPIEPVNQIRIMLVDDHSALRMGLALIISNEADMAVVAQASNGHDAVESFRKTRPDITLLDLKMNGMTGVNTAMAIREEFPTARIIVLTSYDRDEDIYQSMKAGAMGYLVKDTPSDEIITAIRIVHRGRRHIPARVTEKLAERLTMPDLSEREIEVLNLMTAGLSNKEIAQSLSLALGTVKYHINNILSKLGAVDRTQAVIIALKKGLTELK